MIDDRSKHSPARLPGGLFRALFNPPLVNL